MSPIALPKTAQTPRAIALKAARAGTGDDFALSELLLTSDLTVSPGTDTARARTKSAGTGNGLPDDQQADDDAKTGTARRKVDPLFSWITAMLAPPVPTSVAATAQANAGDVMPPDNSQVSTASSAAIGAHAAGESVVGITALSADDSLAGIVARADANDCKLVPPTIAGGATAVAHALPATAAPGDATGPAAQMPANPAASAAPIGAAQTARDVFATAIIAAEGRRATDRKPDEAEAQPAVAGIASVSHGDAIKTSEPTHQGGADLHQDTGLQSMIDHIEMVRDAADATDTRIRLSPAGLGTVEVAVRKEGDAVHVHFTAEQPEARTLIADAQPRLSELAQARGIRLGETSISGGASDAYRQQPQQTFASGRAAPARAASIQIDRSDVGGDGRIA